MTSRPSGFALTGGGRLRLYSVPELLRLPAPTWLVDGYIPQGGFVGLYGPSGEGKSFVAIDLALAVATGRPWQGIPTTKQFVVYIAAEGGVGSVKRIAAWLHHYKVDPAEVDAAWLIESLSVQDDADDLARLMSRLEDEVERRPGLIILDTLARCFDGDENKQEDMGKFIAGVDRMRLAYGATVVIVHHTNKGGQEERGSGSFKGAAETMIAVHRSRDTGLIDVVCKKQKDDAEFEPLELTFQLVPEYKSVIVVRAETTKADTIVQWLAAGPLPFADLKARIDEPGSHMSLATLKRKLRELKNAGRICKNIEGFYELTEDAGSGSHDVSPD